MLLNREGACHGREEQPPARPSCRRPTSPITPRSAGTPLLVPPLPNATVVIIRIPVARKWGGSRGALNTCEEGCGVPDKKNS